SSTTRAALDQAVADLPNRLVRHGGRFRPAPGVCRRGRPMRGAGATGAPRGRGCPTTPTVMRRAGIDDYESFALELVELVPDLPLSFEVFADDFDDMERQALKIATWGPNVYVKIPVTDTRGRSSARLQRV